jgi:AcrR family transcriptional regulator
MSSAPSRTRRRPRQARSQVTVAAILEATVRVLLKRGYEACSTKEVAEVAGVGIGSVYEYFPNKEALIAGVVEREADRYMEVIKRELVRTERPFAEALRLALRAALAEVEPRRQLVSFLLREYPLVSGLTALGRLPMRAADLATFCLEHWADEVNASDGPATYLVLSNMMIGAYFSHVVAPAGQVSSEAFLDAIERVLLKVLEPRGGTFQTGSMDAAE